jgi:hypothetical protein
VPQKTAVPCATIAMVAAAVVVVVVVIYVGNSKINLQLVGKK